MPGRLLESHTFCKTRLRLGRRPGIQTNGIGRPFFGDSLRFLETKCADALPLLAWVYRHRGEIQRPGARAEVGFVDSPWLPCGKRKGRNQLVPPPRYVNGGDSHSEEDSLFREPSRPEAFPVFGCQVLVDCSPKRQQIRNIRSMCDLKFDWHLVPGRGPDPTSLSARAPGTKRRGPDCECAAHLRNLGKDR